MRKMWFCKAFSMTPSAFTHHVSPSQCKKKKKNLQIYSQRERKREKKETLCHLIQKYSDIYCGLTAGLLKGNIDLILARFRPSKI